MGVSAIGRNLWRGLLPAHLGAVLLLLLLALYGASVLWHVDKDDQFAGRAAMEAGWVRDAWVARDTPTPPTRTDVLRAGDLEQPLRFILHLPPQAPPATFDQAHERADTALRARGFAPLDSPTSDARQPTWLYKSGADRYLSVTIARAPDRDGAASRTAHLQVLGVLATWPDMQQALVEAFASAPPSQ